MLKACANAGNLDKAEQLYESMCGLGPSCLILVMCVAQYVVSFGRGQRIAPNGKTFGKLMEAAAKSADIDPLARTAFWLREMRKSTLRPQLLNYNELISAAANMHDVNSAVAWFDHLEKENLQPNVISFNSVLSAAAKKGALDISVQLDFQGSDCDDAQLLF